MEALRVLARLLRGRAFRRLMWVRLLSQGGDGMFQVGVATAFFFDPTEGTSAAEIAAGFAILFLPFTIVGPFTGPFVDRWSRQRIILFGNVVRVSLVGAIITLVLAGAPVWSLYAVTLLTLSVNRFLLVAMTAGLPLVVAKDELLTANSIVPTLGTVAAALGGFIGAAATFLVGPLSDSSLALVALIGAGVSFGASSWSTMLLGRRQLGPERPLADLAFWRQMAALARELGATARYLAGRRTPALALGEMALQRLLYGLMFVMAILIARHVLGDPNHPERALGNFGVILAFAAVGFGLAAVVTPAFGQLVSRHRWILVGLAAGVVGQAVVAAGPHRWVLLTGTLIVSFAVQAGKIAVDTVVQRDTVDHHRGRAFMLYDMGYNSAMVSAALVVVGLTAVGWLPETGYSQWVMGAVGAAYVALFAAFAATPRQPREVADRGAA